MHMLLILKGQDYASDYERKLHHGRQATGLQQFQFQQKQLRDIPDRQDAGPPAAGEGLMKLHPAELTHQEKARCRGARKASPRQRCSESALTKFGRKGLGCLASTDVACT